MHAIRPDDLMRFFEPPTEDEVRKLIQVLPETPLTGPTVRLNMILGQEELNRANLIRRWKQNQENHRLMWRLWQLIVQHEIRDFPEAFRHKEAFVH